MRPAIAAAFLLLAACAMAPLRPADPAQAVANDRSAATAAAAGVRVIVRPGAWPGYRGDLDDYLTPVEVAIQNGSGRPLQIGPASFSLLTPSGFRYEALSSEDVRHALGPWRGGAYGYSFYSAYPVGGPFYPWGPPWALWAYGPHPWWGAVPYYGSGYGVPSRALVKGTLDPGGSTSVLLLFPVAANELQALELDASFVDGAGARVAELRVPFVREGQRPMATPLPPTAAPGPGAPQQPAGTWQTTPPPRSPGGEPPAPQPQVDQPVGPPPEPPPPR